jgi:hypothetical protein
MIRGSVAASLILMALSASLAASEAWKSKAVRDWSADETRDFLRNSPWVRQVRVGGSLVEAAPPDAGQTGEGRGESSQAQGRTERSEPGVETGGSRGGTVYYIEWSSAKIVRQASVHFGALEGRTKEEGVEPPDLPFFTVSVHGPDLKAFAGATEADLKAGASLRAKRAKTKIDPTQVKIRKGQEDRILSIQFSFAREADGKPVISPEEKTVEFT